MVHVLATMGAAGQMLSVQGKIVEKTTQMVEASDTMGAGDSFLADFIHEQYKGCQISHKIGTVFSSPTDRNSGKYLYHSTLWGVSVPTVLPGNWSTALLPVHGGAPAKSDGV